MSGSSLSNDNFAKSKSRLCHLGKVWVMLCELKDLKLGQKENGNENLMLLILLLTMVYLKRSFKGISLKGIFGIEPN